MMIDITKRKHNITRATREVVQRENLLTKSLSGTLIPKVSKCRTCKRWLNLTSFYRLSKVKRARNSQGGFAFSDEIESECVSCWDKRGRDNKNPEIITRRWTANKTKNKNKLAAKTIIKFIS